MSATAEGIALSAQLQQLNDRQAISDLILRLGLMLDDKHYDEARSIFTDDVLVRTAGGSARGAEAAVEHARRNHTVRTQHAITGVLIKLDGDRAEARSNLIVTFVPASDEPEARLMIGGSIQPEFHLMIGERYRFEAVRGDAGWRLAVIEVARLWSTEPIPSGALVTATDPAANTAA